MSDDFDRLRRTMADLSEHGGEADLYDRMLRTSRRMTRRRHAAAAGAVAAAVLAVAVPVAMVDRNRPVSPPVADQSTPAPDPSSAPAPTSAPTSTPASSPPSKTVTSPSSARSSAATDGCPVSAKTLTQAAGSPEGYRITAAGITCYQGWAQGEEKAPTEAEQGDGVLLFRYDRSRAKWLKVTEGSALECADYGVPERVRNRLPACHPQ